MKNWLKVLLAVMLVLTCMFAYVACDNNSGDNTGGNNQNNQPGDNSGGSNLPESPDDDEYDDLIDSDDAIRINFYYSYTGPIKDPATGRTEIKSIRNIVRTIYIPSENAAWTDKLIDLKNNLTYNGYSFADWYHEDDWDRKSNPEKPKGDPFKFEGAIKGDLNLYAYKGNLAGDDIVWEIVRDENTNDVILNLTGSGKMFDFANRVESDIPWYINRDEITKIVMDDRIENVGQNAFASMTKLKEIHFSESIKEIGNYAFYETTSKNFKVLRTPANVEKIGQRAFSNTKLTQVILNDGLKTISDNCFYGSNEMRWIVLPKSVETIGLGAFHPGGSGSSNNKHKLSKVYYGGSLTDFYKINIYSDNDWLSKIPTIYTYQENIDETSEGARLSWYYINSNGLNYPAQYSYAIKYFVDGKLVPIAIDYVTCEPKITNGVQEFNKDGNPIFQGFVKQENIDFREALQYNGYTFNTFSSDNGGNPIAVGHIITGDMSQKCVRAINGSDGLRSGVLGGGVKWHLLDGVLTISPSDNPEDTNRTWDVTDAADAAMLWYGKLSDALNVKKLIINPGVKYIGSYTFAGIAIGEVVLPESLEGIHSSAFDNCLNLYSIYYEGDDIANCEGLATIKTLSASVFAKKTEHTADEGSYWMDLDGGKKIAWRLQGGKLYVGGDSEMVDFALPSDAPWYPAKDSITSVSIAPNIISVGEHMVSGYSNITKISLNPHVKYIPESAFEATAILNNLTAYKDGMLIVDNVLLKVDPSRRNTEFFVTTTDISVIAGGAFSRCTKVKTIFIATTVTYINADALEDCAIERIYVETGSVAWKSTAKDIDWATIQIFYAGDFTIKDGVYTPLPKCNHVYGDWTITVAPTCQTDGERVCTCIFGDNCTSIVGRTKKEAIPAGSEYHVWGEYVDNGDDTETAHCTTCPEDDKAIHTRPIQ